MDWINKTEETEETVVPEHHSKPIRHNVAEILLVAFVGFVFVMILFHCYLKRNERKHFKRMAKKTSTRFEWERDSDDEY